MASLTFAAEAALRGTRARTEFVRLAAAQIFLVRDTDVVRRMESAARSPQEMHVLTSLAVVVPAGMGVPVVILVALVRVIRRRAVQLTNRVVFFRTELRLVAV